MNDELKVEDLGAPEAALEEDPRRYDWPRFYVDVLSDGPSPWFIAKDVCEALDVPVAQIKRMPEHARKKVTNRNGRKVWAVNSDGFLWLVGATELTRGRGEGQQWSCIPLTSKAGKAHGTTGCARQWPGVLA